MRFPMMSPQGGPKAVGDALNLGAPLNAPPVPPATDALASIKAKLGVGMKRKSLPGVGFKKPLSKVTKKAVSGMRGLKRKMERKGKK